MAGLSVLSINCEWLDIMGLDVNGKNIVYNCLAFKKGAWLEPGTHPAFKKGAWLEPGTHPSLAPLALLTASLTDTLGC